VKDANAFKTILNKLDFDTLRKAQTPAFAVKHIAERLNGSHAEGRVMQKPPYSEDAEQAVLSAALSWMPRRWRRAHVALG
jgi:hypothetical protein